MKDQTDSLSADDVGQAIESILETVDGDEFTDWLSARQTKENVKNGTPWYNLPGYSPDPERHSPSKLLRCHRKAVYDANNAPAEEQLPRGVFHMGDECESLIEEFAWTVADEMNLTVRNDVRVDFEIDRDGTYVRISGNTDPVICGPSGTEYLLPLEVKSRYDLSGNIDPNPSHKAQLHAYIAGLRRKRGGRPDIDRGLLVYVSRQTLEVTVLQISFDEEFWNNVLAWAEDQTHYRLDDELPPATPAREEECRYCDYAIRCGQGSVDLVCEDELSGGLIPLYDYPAGQLVEYLRDNPAFGLTPTTAWSNKDLAETYDVYQWRCHACGAARQWDELEPARQTGNSSESVVEGPRCPECGDCQMRGPDPAEQRKRAGGDDE